MENKVIKMEVEKKVNHPYMDSLERTIDGQKRMLEMLEFRMSYKRLFKDAYERNEHDILLMKTAGEIMALRRSIAEKEKYFIEFMNQFLVDLEECNKKFDEVMYKAKSEYASDEVKKMYQSINWKAVEENDEVKVELYKRFKNKVPNLYQHDPYVIQFTNTGEAPIVVFSIVSGKEVFGESPNIIAKNLQGGTYENMRVFLKEYSGRIFHIRFIHGIDGNNNPYDDYKINNETNKQFLLGGGQSCTISVFIEEVRK
jgi:hypothetical protein